MDKKEIEDIAKNIAFQVLDILSYLQDRVPLIIHRDIKPENVLVDRNLSVYLVDFGLARIGNHTMALNSVMGGTMGFMPPEQVQSKQLTKASDLYGLGATLICLITQTKSSEIGSLVSFDTNKITFRNQASKFSSRFIQWLEKMVEPNPANRYQSAKLALTALQNINLTRTSQVALSNPPYLWLLGWFMLIAVPTSTFIFISMNAPSLLRNAEIVEPMIFGFMAFSITFLFYMLRYIFFGVECWDKVYGIASISGASGGIIGWVLKYILSPQYNYSGGNQALLFQLKAVQFINYAFFGSIAPLITLAYSSKSGQEILDVIFNVITQPYVWVTKNIFKFFDERRYIRLFSVSSFLLITFFAIATGVGVAIGFKFYVLLSLLTTGLPLIGMFCYSSFKMRRLNA